MKKENSISRRSFLKSSAMAGAVGAIGTGSAAVLTSCGGGASGEKAGAVKALKEPGTYYVPNLVDFATDGQELKAGIIGCGGRGSGAAFDFLNAANGVTVTALADTFKDRVDSLAEKLKTEKGIDIPESMRFVGLDAYKQVIDSGVDVVIVATPPNFRPTHFQYATEKGKHSFLEKPICVDPVGYRTIVATAKQAQAKNLCVITGTQRHHQRNYVAAYQKVMEGMIGEITGGTVYWNQSMLWFRERQAGWSDCEWMIRDWVNWKWLSGDHIVEQHVHNIDVFTWFSGLKPKTAVGFGSRHRRVTGDQYDNFSVDFEMENGIHMHSMCRQIDGCVNNVSEFFQGTKGTLQISAGNDAVIKDLAGNEIWKYDFEAEKANTKQQNPYVLEHVNWINHIRSKKPIDQASETAIACMAAIMGRESAYSGEMSTWDAMTTSPLDYLPKDLNLGKMDMSGFTTLVPGKPRDQKK
ncbi:putative dehydrogenase [Parabacteroides sp. PF5-5]|uniref:Gfo/Idh/MocA family oxidoreductase n=1 Tax=unclassified Parabacteroides TaxID=2649774 RepID=UPI002474E2D3|nr:MULTISPECIES: Gfo/Idh/MocA family oxidoreductase [unclassified Parabacteroides]MDH6305368.1 putative dehydrogenase [Parabacteroides sp. PH5-39]MDH6316721.1 putative dehydrogenase [Parabacteroides sp. PF5-13]MDH6320099.1 putative dehydrogenase [Parabacteroides sp. PH5-13]MDH6323958.1 putative dehydrogenase [Parabacteroides sp. PH5-8]MDH6327776.1 putative dehydrogenase [Parabacteroides sp. PH5-41]